MTLKTKPTKYYRPTWAEIDLSSIRHNFSQVKKLIEENIKVLVAVKANAYGHGILQVSSCLVKEGVDYLGVGTTDEALYLRNNGFKVPILILGVVLKHEVESIIKNNITQTVSDMQLCHCINNVAKKLRRKANVHIKVDTGMGRIGVWHEQALEFVKKAKRLNSVEIEGIFSHFSSADDDELLTCRQIKDFTSLIDRLEKVGIYIKYKHLANSMGAIAYKDSHMNLIRPGLMIYGLNPKPGMVGNNIDLRPSLSIKSKIVFIKDVPSGRKISYGGSYTTTSRTKIATVPIGYGDGLNRHLSNRGWVLIRGKEAPILGRVCMDQIMVDVGGMKDAKIGDEVVIIGTQKKESITVEDIAILCDTIAYEVCCWFDKRVPLVYLH